MKKVKNKNSWNKLSFNFSSECLPVWFAREEICRTSSCSRTVPIRTISIRTNPIRTRNSGIVGRTEERFPPIFLELVRSGPIRDIEVGVCRVDLATKLELFFGRNFLVRIFVRSKSSVFRRFFFVRFCWDLQAWPNGGEFLHLVLPFFDRKLIGKMKCLLLYFIIIIIY